MELQIFWRKQAIRILSAFVVVMAALAVNASAIPITYVHTGFGSGTLNGITFGAASPVPFAITARGDTSNIVSFPAAGGRTGFSNDNITASITIDSIGTFDFITPTRYFSSDGVGFSRAGLDGADLFSFPAIRSWDMLSSIGPITGPGPLFQWNLSPVVTTGGVLSFNDSSFPATFTATVGGTLVPEPTSLLLLAVGVLGLSGWARLRWKSSDVHGARIAGPASGASRRHSRLRESRRAPPAREGRGVRGASRPDEDPAPPAAPATAHLSRPLVRMANPGHSGR